MPLHASWHLRRALSALPHQPPRCLTTHSPLHPPPPTAAGFWSNTSSNLPAPRADFAAVPVGERVYIFGGQDGSSFLDSTTVYDAVLDR